MCSTDVHLGIIIVMRLLNNILWTHWFQIYEIYWQSISVNWNALFCCVFNCLLWILDEIIDAKSSPQTMSLRKRQIMWCYSLDLPYCVIAKAPYNLLFISIHALLSLKVYEYFSNAFWMPVTTEGDCGRNICSVLDALAQERHSQDLKKPPDRHN